MQNIVREGVQRIQRWEEVAVKISLCDEETAVDWGEVRVVGCVVCIVEVVDLGQIVYSFCESSEERSGLERWNLPWTKSMVIGSLRYLLEL